jgi:hypothetical protein
MLLSVKLYFKSILWDDLLLTQSLISGNINGSSLLFEVVWIDNADKSFLCLKLGNFGTDFLTIMNKISPSSS